MLSFALFFDMHSSCTYVVSDAITFREIGIRLACMSGLVEKGMLH